MQSASFKKVPANLVDLKKVQNTANLQVSNDFCALFSFYDNLTTVFNVGCSNSTDGSVYMEYKGVKLHVAVYGPSELMKEGQLVVEFKIAPFARNPHNYMTSGLESKFSSLILSAIEPGVILPSFPQGTYQIRIMVLDDARSDEESLLNILAASVTATSIALSHAGVQMYDLPLGVTVGSKTHRACLSVLPNMQQITMTYAHPFSHSDICNFFESNLDTALKEATQSLAHVKSILISCYNK